MKLDLINTAAETELKEALERCCGSSRWVEGMAAARPYESIDAVYLCADQVWLKLSPEDWREAFAHHPKIGDIESLRAKYANTRQWAEGEQKGVQEASEAVLKELSQLNQTYEDKFGYIFIVCATGKSASEMLAILKQRLGNDPADEITKAAHEQSKITRIRLEKLLA